MVGSWYEGKGERCTVDPSGSLNLAVARFNVQKSEFPVKARIQYKIACLCFQCIYQNSMPPHISDLLQPHCPSRTLRSLGTSLLTVPRFSLETFGKKSFSVFGPTVWNSLPLSLRKAQCFTTFKAKLKTRLFRTHLCLIGCFSMIVWTPTVFECLICMRFLFLYLHLFSAIEHVSHGKAL